MTKGAGFIASLPFFVRSERVFTKPIHSRRINWH